MREAPELADSWDAQLEQSRALRVLRAAVDEVLVAGAEGDASVLRAAADEVLVAGAPSSAKEVRLAVQLADALEALRVAAGSCDEDAWRRAADLGKAVGFPAGDVRIKVLQARVAAVDILRSQLWKPRPDSLALDAALALATTTDIPEEHTCVKVATRFRQALSSENVGDLAAARLYQLKEEASGATGEALDNTNLVRDFAQRGRLMFEDGGAERASVRVVYHWTPERNFTNIVSGGLKVPGASNGVAHQTDSGFYGEGIYTSPEFEMYRGYGHGASRCFLCLCLPGRRFPAHHPEHSGVPLRRGHDSHFNDDHNDGPADSQWVFFSDAQLLPVLLVDAGTLEASKRVTESLVQTVTHEINTAGKLALLSHDRSLMRIVLQSFQTVLGFRKDRSAIARRWARLLVRHVRKEHERRARKARRMVRATLRQTPRYSPTVEFVPWEVLEEGIEAATRLRSTQALTGPTNSSKPRRHWDEACARRHAAADVRQKDSKSRRWQAARARARDEKVGEPPII